VAAVTARQQIHTPGTVGERVADRVAAAVGSWRFIVTQGFFLALWITLNVTAFVRHWDAAPFILLNLLLSFQAAFTGPVVMLAQNRAAQRDALRDNLEAEEVAELHAMNRRQLEILELLRERAACDGK
jgi:uncharacterized membrane protein